ncbi:DUF4263 domain-containing protein [Mucilaginibacter gossypii]|uniref:Shedu immune nuclease family protein n=1 Tax=Mucilaginibacter gossypii TaxID=551996 RepID=UPI000DCAF75A|nr:MULTISPECIES: Shedu immune nuclease family protein [Mucilaginibacter]QTE36119.1 DUF4263 domain-containing protein [Mucilaginibacter gossypii]RAV59966.1 hypothetical protein DIU36_03060 [Mucilaginibacter rubeus]
MAEKVEKYTPKQENKTVETPDLERYFYCDESGLPIFLTKEIHKAEKKIIFYPFRINTADGSVVAKRIQRLEFIGWDNVQDIPNDFKLNGKYGLRTPRSKSFFNALYSKYKDVRYFTIGINIENSFKSNHIILNWADLRLMFNEIYTQRSFYERERSYLINKGLSKINDALFLPPRHLRGGDINKFLHKFDSFERIAPEDLDSLYAVLEVVPPSIIKTTSNFINAKEQINKVYIEDIIEKFEKLMSSTKDNEKQWQEFFEKNTWILSHLFPYEVILREREAYIGGKTIGNDNGRIIDFLFENGFKDNYALLEIKTHKKELLKKQVYRKPSVFAMSDDFSGGVGQCLDQKDIYLKEFGKSHASFDPKCILIIGMKSILSAEQKHCFELLRSSQKNIEIVTFDEILMKLKGLMKVLSYSV